MISSEQIDYCDVLIGELRQAPRFEGFNYVLQGRIAVPIAPSPLLVAVVGPSGSGKTTLIDGFSIVKTATSRSPQQRDKPDAYIWMDPETPENIRSALLDLELTGDTRYRKYLEDRYRLVESNLYGGDRERGGYHLYGTPSSSITSALKNPTGIAFATSEPNGASLLRRNIDPNHANVVVLGVIPSSGSFIEGNLGKSRTHPEERFNTGLEELQWMKQNCDFFVDNREGELQYVRSEISAFFLQAVSNTQVSEQCVFA